MRLVRLAAALLALATAACGSMQTEPNWVAQSPLIDQPTVYPYNSLICP